MLPLTSTLSNLTAAMLKSYGAPPPSGPDPSFVPSTDANVFVTASYIEQLNANFAKVVMVDQPNQALFAHFSGLCDAWESNRNGKDASAIPAFPQYDYFDNAAFHLAWGQFTNSGGFLQPIYVKQLPVLPAVQIIPEGQVVATTEQTDGPIGKNLGGGYFESSGINDAYTDSQFYQGPTGTYQKHIFANPFTKNQSRTVWVKI